MVRARLLLLGGEFVLLLACGPSAAVGDDDAPQWPRCNERVDGPVRSPLAGPADECSSYVDIPAATREVAVWMHNDGPNPIVIVPYGCNETLFVVEGGGGVAPFDCSTPLCADVMDGDDGGCLATCRLTDLVRIEPGGAYRIAWDAIVYYPQTPPLACLPPDLADLRSCAVVSDAIPGFYVVSARAADASTCTDPELCACEAGETESCVLPPAAADAWNQGEILPQSYDVEEIAPWNGECDEIHLSFRLEEAGG